MEWINYHHLLYFWMAAKNGTIARASKELRLAQPTLSGQIRALELSLGQKLFEKSGRTLALTEAGRLVFRYADEIFELGNELSSVLKGRPARGPLKLIVGASDMMPKLLTYQIVAPAMALPEPVQIFCRQGSPERLLNDLSTQNIDLLLTDAPMPPGGQAKTYNHLLGSCNVSIFAIPEVASTLRKRFPASLEGAPFLLPAKNSTLRAALDLWFDSQQVQPKIVGEFQDSAVMKVFAQAGAGAFAAPSIIDQDLRQRYGVVPVGKVKSMVERFYAITIDRRIKHPAVVAICDVARRKLFGEAG